MIVDTNHKKEIYDGLTENNGKKLIEILERFKGSYATKYILQIIRESEGKVTIDSVLELLPK